MVMVKMARCTFLPRPAILKTPTTATSLSGLFTVCRAQNGHNIVLAAHIDDFVIACADRPALDSVRSRLLEVFDGTYEGEIHTYLGCEITSDLEKGITVISQKHCAEEILLIYGSWDTVPCSTVLPPGKCLEKSDTTIIPDKIFHLRYRGIFGSLGYLVNLTRPDLAFAYSELSKYVQCPQPAHMLACPPLPSWYL